MVRKIDLLLGVSYFVGFNMVVVLRCFYVMRVVGEFIIRRRRVIMVRVLCIWVWIGEIFMSIVFDGC